MLELEGAFYPAFLTRQRDGMPMYGSEEQEAITQTVGALLNEDTTERPGMLLGKIQSGKTKVFLGIIALAFDNGYDIAVILTKPTKALAKQTHRRVAKEFADFIQQDESQVYDILELPDPLTNFELNQKLVFIVKKQTDNLDRLFRTLSVTYPALAGRKVLIVDDEADNASIGYEGDGGGGLQLRAIADQVNQLRRDLAGSSFLQVTATPYSLYLQPAGAPLPNDGLKPVRPRFTKLVPVHPEYVGGDFYFEDSRTEGHPASFVFEPIPLDEINALRRRDGRVFSLESCLTTPKIAGLRKAVMNFITAGCVRRLQDEQANARRKKKFAFLLHTEAARASHSWQELIVDKIKDKLHEEVNANPAFVEQLVRESYDDLTRSIIASGIEPPAFVDVHQRVVSSITQDEMVIVKVNSENDILNLLDDDGQLRLRNLLNFFIGGQILDRGITISNLLGFYYGRNPAKFQQDTVLQHSRMYGFRPLHDRAVTRFYTATQIHRAMRQMHESDKALRERVASQGDDQFVHFVELGAGGNIIPCGPAKVAASSTMTLKPHQRVLPIGFQTDSKTRQLTITEAVDKKLKTVGAYPGDGQTPTPHEISVGDAIEIIDLVSPTFKVFDAGHEDSWDAEEYKALIRHMAKTSPTMHAVVRIGREISRFLNFGTQRFTHAPDNGQTDLEPARRVAVDTPALILLRQNGREQLGWKGAPFWWPILLMPGNIRTTIFAHKG